MAQEIKKVINNFMLAKMNKCSKFVITFKQVDNNEIDIDHTGVADELGGQGLGKQLVEAAVNYARENNLKIIASCPFAKDVLEKNDDYQDVYLG